MTTLPFCAGVEPLKTNSPNKINEPNFSRFIYSAFSKVKIDFSYFTSPMFLACLNRV